MGKNAQMQYAVEFISKLWAIELPLVSSENHDF
jgi:hypothetical protein